MNPILLCQHCGNKTSHAIIEYVYIAPEKIRKLKNKIKVMGYPIITRDLFHIRLNTRYSAGYKNQDKPLTYRNTTLYNFNGRR